MKEEGGGLFAIPCVVLPKISFKVPVCCRLKVGGVREVYVRCSGMGRVAPKGLGVRYPCLVGDLGGVLYEVMWQWEKRKSLTCIQ